MLLVLHTEQVLAHYFMIDQLIATVDCCQLTALEASSGSGPWLTIVYLYRRGARLSEWWDELQ